MPSLRSIAWFATVLLHSRCLICDYVVGATAAASHQPSQSIHQPSTLTSTSTHHHHSSKRRGRSYQPPNTLANSLNLRAGSSTHSNKKYTDAAAAAMKTLNSLTSKSYRQSANLPNLLSSESALMDKETNAIYWQGGTDVFSSSLTKPYLTQRGVLHVRATILTIALWLWVWGRVSRFLTTKYFDSRVEGHKLLFTLPFLSSFGDPPPFLKKIASVLAPIVSFIVLILHSLLYLRLPQYSPRVLAATIVMYLIESFSCSTRR